MLKFLKITKILAFCLIIIFTSIAYNASMFAEIAEPPSAIQDKLTQISEEEKKILQYLFTMVQELEVLENEEVKLTQNIAAINQNIGGLEQAISKEEKSFSAKQEALRQVLLSYQRMGPGSYLEIILSSESLPDLLSRINILRDLTRNTGELLVQLESSKEKLFHDKKSLTEGLVLLEERQKKSREALSAKVKLKAEKEAYLASLKEEKEYYNTYMEGLQQQMDELKPLLSRAAGELSSLVKENRLPKDMFKISFSLFGVKGTIEDKAFNELISKSPSLSEFVFSFRKDKIEISLPERNLVLSGDFVVLDGQSLKFQAAEGYFYDMPLETEYIEGFFAENEFVLDLKPILGRNTLEAIKLREGYLELFIR